MKSILVTVGLLLSSMGVAFADGGAGPTWFTMYEAKNNQPQTPPRVQTSAVEMYMNSTQQGTWLFSANQNEGANN